MGEVRGFGSPHKIKRRAFEGDKKGKFSLARSLVTTINGGKFDLHGESTFVGEESGDEERIIE